MRIVMMNIIVSDWSESNTIFVGLNVVVRAREFLTLMLHLRADGVITQSLPLKYSLAPRGSTSILCVQRITLAQQMSARRHWAGLTANIA